jgi:hypothetical protein
MKPDIRRVAEVETGSDPLSFVRARENLSDLWRARG